MDFGFDGFDESLFEAAKEEECFETKLNRSLANYRAKHIEDLHFLQNKSTEPDQLALAEKAKGEYWYSLKEFEKSSQCFRKSYDLVKPGTQLKNELVDCLARSLLKGGKYDETERLAQDMENNATNADSYSSCLYLRLDLLIAQLPTNNEQLLDKYADVVCKQITVIPFMVNLWIKLADLIYLKYSNSLTNDKSGEEISTTRPDQLLDWFTLAYAYIKVLCKSKLLVNDEPSKLKYQHETATDWLEKMSVKCNKERQELETDTFAEEVEKMLDAADSCDDAVKFNQAKSSNGFRDFTQKWFSSLGQRSA